MPKKDKTKILTKKSVKGPVAIKHSMATSQVEAQMKIAETIMREDRDVLRALKSS